VGRTDAAALASGTIFEMPRNANSGTSAHLQRPPPSNTYRISARPSPDTVARRQIDRGPNADGSGSNGCP
jgi:hypothetical protein